MSTPPQQQQQQPQQRYTALPSNQPAQDTTTASRRRYVLADGGKTRVRYSSRAVVLECNCCGPGGHHFVLFSIIITLIALGLIIAGLATMYWLETSFKSPAFTGTVDVHTGLWRGCVRLGDDADTDCKLVSKIICGPTSHQARLCNTVFAQRVLGVLGALCAGAVLVCLTCLRGAAPRYRRALSCSLLSFVMCVTAFGLNGRAQNEAEDMLAATFQVNVQVDFAASSYLIMAAFILQFIVTYLLFRLWYTVRVALNPDERVRFGIRTSGYGTTAQGGYEGHGADETLQSVHHQGPLSPAPQQQQPVV